MATDLSIDCGNTRMKAAWFAGDELVDYLDLPYDELHLLDKELAAKPVLRAMFSADGSHADDVLAFVQPHCATPVVTLDSTTPLPLVVAYKTPATLGTDRIAAAVGAWVLRTGCNILVVDAGTAMTLDVVLADGVYLGGRISAGVAMRLEALHEHTRLLPTVSVEGDTPFVGADTAACMRSGAIMGAAAEIDQLAAQLTATVGRLAVVLTGGDADVLAQHLTTKGIIADKHLVLRGLNCLLNYTNDN